MDTPRRHRLARLALTTPVVLAAWLGSVATSVAQPGSLVQLPRPDACTADVGDDINCTDGIGLDGAQDVEISPDGRNVYVVSFGSNSVTTFSRDIATGVLTQLPAPDGCLADNGDGFTCTAAIGLLGAAAVTISPDGAFVYVAAAFSTAVTIFERDPLTGALTQLPAPDGCISQFGGGSTGCTDAVGPIAPSGLQLSPDGDFLYTAAINGNAIGAFARDPVTGTLTQLAAPNGCIAENGDGITCTDGVGLDGANAIALPKNGRHLYVASRNSNAIAIFARSNQTGILTQLPAPNGCIAENGDGITCTDGVGLDGVAAIEIAKGNKHVYVASIDGDAIAAFVRTPSTGVLTQLAAPNGCLTHDGDGITCTAVHDVDNPRGLALSKNGRNVYVASSSADSVTGFRRNKMTGVLTQLVPENGCASLSGDGPCAPALALNGATAATVSKNGRFVYVASSMSDAVAVFERE